MHKGFKKDKIAEFVKNGVDLYLAQNVEYYGFSHVIDVNMSEDLKVAHIYFSCPVDKNPKTLENKIVKDKHEISKIFSKIFSSKFTPKTKFICIRELDVEL